jgi:hypothetical protein
MSKTARLVICFGLPDGSIDAIPTGE